jgi:DNA-binding GntR family transcriptional regulator
LRIRQIFQSAQGDVSRSRTSGNSAFPIRGSATARVYGILKEQILTCQLPPGAGLNEGRLAEQLSVSKTPIREALAMLSHEGFIEVLPRQGYRVTDLTLADVQEIFNLRLLLEPAAAALAAERATADQLQALRSLAEEHVEVDSDEGFAAMIAQSREFHVRLAEASGNRRLAETLQHLLEEMQRLYLSGLNLRQSVEDQRGEHRDLVAALLKGNHHLAHDIAVRQIESSRERVMDALLGAMSSPAAAGVKLTLERRRSAG